MILYLEELKGKSDNHLTISSILWNAYYALGTKDTSIHETACFLSVYWKYLLTGRYVNKKVQQC